MGALMLDPYAIRGALVERGRRDRGRGLLAAEMNRAERAKLLTGMVAAAAEAGTRIHAMAAAGLLARSKADKSPVTDADVAAEKLIEERLSALLPNTPMIGEEAVASGRKTSTGTMFFLVDPIDGTREFIAKRTEYTVNIALLIDGTPALGVIYAPALGELYAGGADGAWRMTLPPGADPAAASQEKINVRAAPKTVVAAISHSHLDAATLAWLKKRAITETMKLGSSIKFARVAEGKADVYPRLAPVSEWDIAAGHAILMAAGGAVKTPDGRPLQYGKRNENYEVESFVASGGGAY
jgi:3'(2'), 5'-bisphosphate nucleotidase